MTVSDHASQMPKELCNALSSQSYRESQRADAIARIDHTGAHRQTSGESKWQPRRKVTGGRGACVAVL